MSIMGRSLGSRALMLVLGSAIASVLNLYSFVVFPALFGVEQLERFVRDNYLGGLYLSAAVSSIGPFSVYVFALGRSPALLRYIVISILCFCLIGVVGSVIARFPWSYICMFAAVCLHGSGFFLASLIRQERMAAACLLQIVHPLLFAVVITLVYFGLFLSVDWAFVYLISTVSAVLLFAHFSDWGYIKGLLNRLDYEKCNWRDVLLRMALSVSFPLFFQMELILCGFFGDVNLGEYAVLQKLYASVSISLFGSVGVLLLNRSIGSTGDAKNNSYVQVLGIAMICAVCVVVVGIILTAIGKTSGIGAFLILLSALLSFLFTMSSFWGMRLSVLRPRRAMLLFALSMIAYLTLIALLKPHTPGQYMLCATFFFSSYILLVIGSERGLVTAFMRRESR